MNEYKKTISKLTDRLQQNEISRQDLFKGLGKHLSILEASLFLKTSLESAYKKIVDSNRELPEHRQRISRVVRNTARHNEISKLVKESKEELKTLEKESSTICRDIGEAAYLSFKKTPDPGEYYLELFSDLAAHDQAIEKIADELDQQHYNKRTRPILKKLMDKGRAALLSSSKSAKMMALPGLYRKAGQKLCESGLGEEAADKTFTRLMAPYLKNRRQAGKIESRNQEFLAEQERLWQELKALGAEKRHQKLVKELEKTTRHIEEKLEQFHTELGKLYCKDHPPSVVSDEYIEESLKKLDRLDKEKNSSKKQIRRLNAALEIERIDEGVNSKKSRIETLDAEIRDRSEQVKELAAGIENLAKEKKTLEKVRGSLTTLATPDKSRPEPKTEPKSRSRSTPKAKSKTRSKSTQELRKQD